MSTPGPGQAPDVPHEGLVLALALVLHFPAPMAEVVEAGKVPKIEQLRVRSRTD